MWIISVHIKVAHFNFGCLQWFWNGSLLHHGRCRRDGCLDSRIDGQGPSFLVLRGEELIQISLWAERGGGEEKQWKGRGGEGRVREGKRKDGEGGEGREGERMEREGRGGGKDMRGEWSRGGSGGRKQDCHYVTSHVQ